MIRSKEEMNVGIEIDLTGPKGNVFYLLGLVKKLCKQIGRDSKPLIEEMTSGDYENTLSVIEKEFGDFVTLYR